MSIKMYKIIIVTFFVPITLLTCQDEIVEISETSLMSNKSWLVKSSFLPSSEINKPSLLASFERLYVALNLSNPIAIKCKGSWAIKEPMPMPLVLLSWFLFSESIFACEFFCKRLSISS